jgi:hypothetical protein
MNYFEHARENAKRLRIEQEIRGRELARVQWLEDFALAFVLLLISVGTFGFSFWRYLV